MIDRVCKHGCGALSGLAALGLVLASTCAFGEQAISVSIDDRTVRVIASDASRREILEALAARGLLVVVSAEALEQRIDFDVGPAAPGDLVRRLLRHDSYMYVERPGVDQVWVFAKSGSRPHSGWHTGDAAVARQIALELTDPDREVRIDAVLAAADLAAAAAVPMLLPAMQDPAPAVRDAAEAVLEDFGATDYLVADRLTE